MAVIRPTPGNCRSGTTFVLGSQGQHRVFKKVIWAWANTRVSRSLWTRAFSRADDLGGQATTAGGRDRKACPRAEGNGGDGGGRGNGSWPGWKGGPSWPGGQLRRGDRGLLSIFARYGSSGFRPKGSTPRDDASETPDETRADNRCPPRSRCRFDGHLLFRVFSPMRPEAGTGDDDHLSSMGQAVQTSRGQ